MPGSLWNSFRPIATSFLPFRWKLCAKYLVSVGTECMTTFQMFRFQPGQRLSLTSFSLLRIEHLVLTLPQGRFARPKSLQLLGSPAISLEPWTATTRPTSITMDSLATVAVASVTSTWSVLLTRPMDQDSGSQNTRCFVQQKAVAARVSGGEKNLKQFVKISRRILTKWLKSKIILLEI